MTVTGRAGPGQRSRPSQRSMGTSIAEARGLDPHAVAIMDLSARASGSPRRGARVLALREEYGPALREARIAVVHSIGRASDLGRAPSDQTPARSLVPLAAAALAAAPLVVALAAWGWGAPLALGLALGAAAWVGLRPAVRLLERGPLYAHGAPPVSRAAAKYLLGDLIDAHASEILEQAGAPAADVASLRARWAEGMAAVLAWRCALSTHDGGESPER